MITLKSVTYRNGYIIAEKFTIIILVLLILTSPYQISKGLTMQCQNNTTCKTNKIFKIVTGGIGLTLIILILSFKIFDSLGYKKLHI